eukprot:22650_1
MKKWANLDMTLFLPHPYPTHWKHNWAPKPKQTLKRTFHYIIEMQLTKRLKIGIYFRILKNQRRKTGLERGFQKRKTEKNIVQLTKS